MVAIPDKVAQPISRGRVEAMTIIALTTVNLVFALTLIYVNGTSSEALSIGLRLTARISFVYFILAFIASPLHQLWASSFSRLLMRNRRAIGVTFGFSMTIHAAFIVALYVRHSPERPPQIVDVDLTIGLPALLFVGLMTVTSISRLHHAIGHRYWSWIHTFGIYFVWFIFFACLIESVERKADVNPVVGYYSFIAILLAVLALRLFALARRLVRRRASGEPAHSKP